MANSKPPGGAMVGHRGGGEAEPGELVVPDELKKQVRKEQVV